MDKINKLIQLSKDKSYQQQQDEILLQPYTYIQESRGKENRSKLSGAFNYWLNIPNEKLHLINEIIQMFHDVSLLFDDIEDDTTIRRGKPVAHSIYGIARSLNAAIYTWFLILEKVQLLNHPEAIKVFTEQMIELHRGQGIDIYWRDDFVVPSEFDYKLMAVQKKSGLFLLSVRLTQLFSANQEDFSKLTAILGLYFQILDDYSNMSVKETAANKGFCPDLTEGKFSFPIIHAMRNEKSREEVLNILERRTHDVEVKKYFIRLLEDSGSLKYTSDVLDALIKEARNEVARLGPNPLMEDLLDKLLSWKKEID